MSFSRAFQWYHSHLDPIWPDGTFKKTFAYDTIAKNSLYTFCLYLRLSTEIPSSPTTSFPLSASPVSSSIYAFTKCKKTCGYSKNSAAELQWFFPDQTFEIKQVQESARIKWKQHITRRRCSELLGTFLKHYTYVKKFERPDSGPSLAIFNTKMSTLQIWSHFIKNPDSVTDASSTST